jgi:hypothetical protein
MGQSVTSRTFGVQRWSGPIRATAALVVNAQQRFDALPQFGVAGTGLFDKRPPLLGVGKLSRAFENSFGG